MSDRPFYGRIVDGNIVLNDPIAFQRLKKILDGQEIEVTLRRRPAGDDLSQLRRYFHGVVLPRIAEAAGYSNDPRELRMVKAGLKERFLTVPAAPGEPAVVRSTESLTKSEYSQFISHCRRWAAETLHIVIEDPH